MIKPMLAYKVDKKPVDWSEKVYINLSLTAYVVLYMSTTKKTLDVFHVQVKNFTILNTLNYH